MTFKVEKMAGPKCLMSKAGIITLVRVLSLRASFSPKSPLIVSCRFLPSYFGCSKYLLRGSTYIILRLRSKVRDEINNTPQKSSWSINDFGVPVQNTDPVSDINLCKCR